MMTATFLLGIDTLLFTEKTKIAAKDRSYSNYFDMVAEHPGQFFAKIGAVPEQKPCGESPS
jgi:hypothetical protein